MLSQLEVETQHFDIANHIYVRPKEVDVDALLISEYLMEQLLGKGREK
jgi:hypothetical protein